MTLKMRAGTECTYNTNDYSSVCSVSFASIRILCLLLYSLVSINCVDAAGGVSRPPENQPRRILLPLPLLARAGSHCAALRVISSTLVERGHHVTLLRSSEEPCNELSGFNATDVIEYVVPDNSAEFTAARDQGQEVASNQLDFQKVAFFLKVCKVFANRCMNLLEKTDLLEDLRHQKFDVVIADLFSPCYALLAEYLDLPLIIITTSREYIFFHRQMFGFPSELSYVPEFGSGLSSQLGVFGKIQNIISRIIARVMGYICLQSFRTILADLGFESSLNTIMTNRTKLWLSYSNLALDYPEPVMPNTIFVGGMAIAENQPLSKVRGY